ncbi:hypothetical protein GIB67_036768 [Kingdonia uniflora]|uniref:Phosphoinositide phospholipase C n=1 Tax=Kingdonia uniflora TaxID=39325 RepID=A0A7J7LWT2_9MAGN|nr:hypothetical protein GIB67_036768 [Kingdonia uniflora]
MSKETYNVCFFFRRKFKVRIAETPDDIKELFKTYCDNEVMTVDQLQQFLIKFQGQTETTIEEAQSIMATYKYHNIFQKKGLNLEGFVRYMFSHINPPIPPKVHHDMNAPLSHYFIYTGHNSYLTGNQLSSDCSDLPIKMALERGVKVVELDLWPNSAEDDVEVLHGRTLTTPVELKKCLTCIKDHAFCVSDYPVVITLEDHLTPNLQDKVAKLIMETFGDMLFLRKSDYLEILPSPEELKKKIIISTKPPVKENENSSGKISGDEETSRKEVLRIGCMGKYKFWLPKVKKEREISNEKVSTDEELWGKEVFDIDYKLDSMDKNEQDGEEKWQDEEVLKYEHLIAIHSGKHKGGLKKSLTVDSNKVIRLSLSEPTLEKAVSKHGEDVLRFTQNNLLRVYPKRTRVTSSNYNPLVGWTHGAQMVAFNMQGYGRSLWLMHGMFRANGGCGYVKKPDLLLRGDPYVFDRKADLPVEKTLKVRVYMGEGWNLDFKRTHFDICSPPDFYTKVGIAGIPADSVMNKTKTILDDWTPVWNEEFEFPLRVPDLALLRIEVHEYDRHEYKDDFAGQACFPVSELREGIRAVPLYSRKLVKYDNVMLLMRFEFLKS